MKQYIIAIVLAVTLVGCGTPASDDPLEIAGSWQDSFGTTHELTDTVWIMSFEGGNPALFQINDFDNDLDVLVAQNDVLNDFNPNLWSRFDWTTDQGILYFCQTVYDAETDTAAREAEPADPTDPTTGGCGGFSWSDLLPL